MYTGMSLTLPDMYTNAHARMHKHTLNTVNEINFPN